MGEPDIGQNVDGSGEGPTGAELLAFVGRFAELVDGRVVSFYGGHGALSVHVASQDDAEYLAWAFSLDHVTVIDTGQDGRGFAVWSGGGTGPEAHYQVCCTGDLVRPVRAYPRRAKPWLLDGQESTSTGQGVD